MQLADTSLAVPHLQAVIAGNGQLAVDKPVRAFLVVKEASLGEATLWIFGTTADVEGKPSRGEFLSLPSWSSIKALQLLRPMACSAYLGLVHAQLRHDLVYLEVRYFGLWTWRSGLRPTRI